MATITAVLHHKNNQFFRTGYYLLDEKGDLMVGPYQGPLACLKLARDKGVCHAGITQEKTIIVNDVNQFPGHIACDSRSKSEIVVPLTNKNQKIVGVLDIDSDKYNSFDETDEHWLTKINSLVFV
ncbi:MAG: GAF domain-containing protein [Bacteroidota bacterium]|nr:GAF domain-containing protein [Bacteroidota bacterium]